MSVCTAVLIAFWPFRQNKYVSQRLNGGTQIHRLIPHQFWTDGKLLVEVEWGWKEVIVGQQVHIFNSAFSPTINNFNRGWLHRNGSHDACIYLCISVTLILWLHLKPAPTWQTCMCTTTQKNSVSRLGHQHLSFVALQARKNYTVWRYRTYLEPTRHLVLTQPCMCQRVSPRIQNLHLISNCGPKSQGCSLGAAVMWPDRSSKIT